MVLRDVDLLVDSGGLHALVGPSGAGKTTLLRIANLLDMPTSGRILVDRHPVASLLATRRKMAMVMQKPLLFRTSVIENAIFALRARGASREEAARRAQPVLEAVGLLRLANRRARSLSGGEQQRLAFARAVVFEPELLLLDEFTANLDPSNVLLLEREIQSFVRRPGRSVLLATHDVFQARRLATEATFLLHGEVVESGGREVLESPRDARTRAFLSGELVA